MIIIYREATGEVVDNTGTNSLFPWGPENDDDGWVNTPDRTGLALLRLHDERDAEQVAAVLAGRARLVDGVVAVLPAPDPETPVEPPTQPPTVEELVARIEALQAWAKDVQDQVDAATEILMGGLA